MYNKSRGCVKVSGTRTPCFAMSPKCLKNLDKDSIAAALYLLTNEKKDSLFESLCRRQKRSKTSKNM